MRRAAVASAGTSKRIFNIATLEADLASLTTFKGNANKKLREIFVLGRESPNSEDSAALLRTLVPSAYNRALIPRLF
jgi:hypothetical protein